MTLALALSLPAVMPQRETLVIAAFAVVLFTLVVEGLTIRPLLEYLKLAPTAHLQREHEATRARLLGLQAAQRRLKRLRDQGSMSGEAYEALNSQYAAQENQLQENLHALYQRHPDLTEREITSARVEGLRAERSALADLNRRGMISDTVYRELAADIDAQLNELIQARAQGREVELGAAERVEASEVEQVGGS